MKFMDLSKEQREKVEQPHSGGGKSEVMKLQAEQGLGSDVVTDEGADTPLSSGTTTFCVFQSRGW